MTTHRSIALIGATGSIGRSVCDVVREHPESFSLVAVAAYNNVHGLEKIINEFHPTYAALYDENAARTLTKKIHNEKCELRSGDEGVRSLATLDDIDTVIISVVGMAGLSPSIAAVRAGKRLALATKEVLVAAGDILLDAAKTSGAEILPVDSEHSAIFQCLHAAGASGNESVEKLILTASGGPFRGKSKKELDNISPAQALNHPTWSMGNKITIDSATLMNKGLEVIEAHWLFQLPAEKIDTVIHPQSIVHSLVEFTDRSVIAQLSIPDMRMPVLYALTYPHRSTLTQPRLDLTTIEPLTFYTPDYDTFPCLRLAYDALKAGGTAPAVLNAANEIAVDRFLNNECAFSDIPRFIESALEKYTVNEHPALEDIYAIDALVRNDTARARSI